MLSGVIKSQKLFDSSTAKKCDRIAAARGLLTIMKIMGVWQWQKENTTHTKFQYYQRLQIVQRFCLHAPITFTYIALMWLQVLFSTDLDQAAEVLYISLTEVALVVKILNIWYYSIKAWNFINELAHGEIFELISQEEIQLWQSKQKQFRNVIIVFLSSTIFTVVCASVSVLFSDDYQLPYAYWVPFDWHSNKRNYWIAYVYNLFGIVVTAVTNVCMDMIGSYFLFHTSILYRILGMRILGLNVVAERNVIKELRKIIIFHGNVRRITRECETLVSIYVLSQILLSAFILCFAGYRIQKMDILANIGQFFPMLQFLLIMILEIYLPCYFGNEIIWNSAQLPTQIYSSKWFTYSISTRKFMLLYLECAKRPAKVKAGNYFDIGLQIFSKVLNNAYSFFALIMNIEK